MTLGMNPPVEYSSYPSTKWIIGLSLAGVTAVVFGIGYAIHENHEKHYNSETCISFRDSVEAQQILEEAGPQTMYKKAPVVRIDGWRCVLR